MRTLIVLGMTLLAVPAWAGSYTVTTTPEQDAALAEMAKQPVRAPGMVAPSAQTPAQMVQTMVDRQLAARVAQIKRAAACAKVTDAATKTALGCPVK